MHRIAILAAGLLAAGLAAGCAGTTEIAAPTGAPEPEARAASAYFIVTRRDVRRCAFPRCGGVFVKRVNRLTTVCADGVPRPECHAATVDLDELGLDEPQRSEFAGVFEQKHALVLGRLIHVDQGLSIPVETLVATEGWRGATQNEPRGRFSRLTDSGIVCITTPCPTVLERQLNTTFTQTLAEVDLAASGASRELVDQGFSELATNGILAAGRSTIVTGPAGTATGFAASEFYLRETPHR